MISALELKVKLYADGASLEDMAELYKNPLIKGFTTNPTLMRKAGVDNYKEFAVRVLKQIPDRPVSFEVFADELPEMLAQGIEISTWGPNVNVKIPITNTKGESTVPIISKLSNMGIKVNVTAVFTLGQVREVTDALCSESEAIISVFAGRIADAGVDPIPLMQEALKIIKAKPKAELLWASPRELFNIVQAHEVGCQILTATKDILSKLPLIGKDLEEYSLETVQMFYKDATASNYSIDCLSSNLAA